MDQAKHCQLVHVYPPSPDAQRGFTTSISAHPESKKLCYCISNVVVVRSTENVYQSEVFDLHKFKTTAVRISPNGYRCASGDERGNLMIWELTSPELKLFKEYENQLGGPIKDIAWTPDNQRIVVVGQGKTYYAKAILVDSGSSLGDITGISKTLLACDLRPERPFKLAVGGEDYQVSFYQGPPFKFVKSSKQHDNYVTTLRYNKTGDLFVTGSTDKKMFLFEGKECGELKELKSEKPHTRTVTSVSWLDEKHYLTSSNDTTVKLWNVDSEDAVLKTFKVGEQVDEIGDMQVGVAVCGNDAYSVSLSGAVNQFKDVMNLADGAVGQRLHGHNDLVCSLTQDFENNLLFSGDNNGKILIWNDKESILPSGEQHKGQIFGVSLSADKSRLYSLAGEQIKQLDVKSRAFVKTGEAKGQCLNVLAGTKNSDVCYVLFENNLVVQYTNLEESKRFELQYETSSFALDHEEKYLFIGDKKGKVHVVSVESGNEEFQLELWDTKVTVLQAAHNKPWLVGGDTQGRMKLWDYASKKELQSDKWVYHTTVVTSLSFSKSQKYVLSTAQDNKFMIWNTETGARLWERADCHKRGVLTGLINGNGDIITSGGDNTIKVWKPNQSLD